MRLHAMGNEAKRVTEMALGRDGEIVYNLFPGCELRSNLRETCVKNMALYRELPPSCYTMRHADASLMEIFHSRLEDFGGYSIVLPDLIFMISTEQDDDYEKRLDHVIFIVQMSTYLLCHHAVNSLMDRKNFSHDRMVDAVVELVRIELKRNKTEAEVKDGVVLIKRQIETTMLAAYNAPFNMVFTFVMFAWFREMRMKDLILRDEHGDLLNYLLSMSKERFKELIYICPETTDEVRMSSSGHDSKEEDLRSKNAVELAVKLGAKTMPEILYRSRELIFDQISAVRRHDLLELGREHSLMTKNKLKKKVSEYARFLKYTIKEKEKKEGKGKE